MEGRCPGILESEKWKRWQLGRTGNRIIKNGECNSARVRSDGQPWCLYITPLDVFTYTSYKETGKRKKILQQGERWTPPVHVGMESML